MDMNYHPSLKVRKGNKGNYPWPIFQGWRHGKTVDKRARLALPPFSPACTSVGN